MKKKIQKSSVTGQFVSDEDLKNNPESTYEQTVDNAKPLNWNLISKVGLPKNYGTYLFEDDCEVYALESLYDDESFDELDADYIAWIRIMPSGWSG